MILIVSYFTEIHKLILNLCFNSYHLVMASKARKLKFHKHLILQPAECTQIYGLAHYEKRLDIFGLETLWFKTRTVLLVYTV